MRAGDGEGALVFHRNDERARVFGRPVLRSEAPDSLLIGYSVTAVDGRDVMVESNHLLRRIGSVPSPARSFTTRTWKTWVDADLEWHFHAFDHVVDTFPLRQSRSPGRPERDELDRRLRHAQRSASRLLIDGHDVTGEAFDFESARFVRVFLHGSMITVAAPGEVLSYGFSSSPRGDIAELHRPG